MNYYIYAHYILNSDIPFYIGVGTKLRAYDSKKRSILWKRYVEKYGLVVKILQENLDKETAMSVEKELIQKYGRINKGTGTLVNLTEIKYRKETLGRNQKKN